MKKRFLFLSTVTSLLLLGSSVNVLASNYNDSVATNKVDKSKTSKAKAEVEELNSKEAFLAKMKTKEFQKEANLDETKRFHNVVDKKVAKHKAALSKAPKEFMEGINDTFLAMRAINSNKPKEAKKILQKAQKEFDISLKKNPDLKLIPVADNAEIISFNGDAELIKHIKDAAIELLEKNDTQMAIDILLPLQDEIVLRTQFVPAYIYPDAIKSALTSLDKGKDKEAFTTLVKALNSIQIDTLIVPIPLITAQDMVLEASKLDKSHKEEALKLLTQAEKELEKAMLLGYTHKYSKSYIDINRQIKALKDEIEGKNIVKKMYEKLLKSFSRLGDKQDKEIQHSK